MDYISIQQDDILLNIISMLPLKEAGRTCLLSKRWTNVWKKLPILNFCDSRVFEIAENIAREYLARHEVDWSKEGPKYCRWVNKVIRLYQGRILDEFKVQFPLDAQDRKKIDRWIKYVMKKGVERLELEFTNWDAYDQNDNFYPLPTNFGCNKLTSLQLKYVNVRSKTVYCFLRNCPLLEDLLICGSTWIVNLKIEGEHLKLKRLAVTYCYECTHIEISAPNLISFEYYGDGTNVNFVDTPKISDVSLGSGEDNHWTTRFVELSNSGYLSQLEVLTVNIDGSVKNSPIPDKIKSFKFPICKRLRCLRLISSLSEDEDADMLQRVIKACPFLHKFILEIDGRNIPKPVDSSTRGSLVHTRT